MELICQLDQVTHRKMLEATNTAGGGGSGGSGGTGGTTTLPAGSADSNRGFEPSNAGSAFSQTSSVNYGGVKKEDKQLPPFRGTRRYGRTESGKPASSGGDISSADVTVIVAKDQVSVASSTFVENCSEALQPSQLPPVTAGDVADIDFLSDSGAASRTSYRMDSDVSIRSVSGHSLVTGDSGCWPK